MKMRVIMMLAVLAAVFVNLNQASAAGNRWADVDVDGVLDSVDRCVESAPVGVDTGLVRLDGCFSSPEACVAFRLAHGGNSHDCEGSPKWASADATLEVARGLTRRQRRDGTLVPVAGNSVARKGDKITCSQEGSILYTDGKGYGKGRPFQSAFGAEQPPFCAHRVYAADAVVAAPRPEVSKKDLDAALSTATGSISARLAEIDAKLAASAASSVKTEGRLATLEGYFTSGGLVDKMSTQLLELVNRTVAVEEAATNAQSTADAAMAAASGQRAWRFTLRGGVSGNSLDVADGPVKTTGFHRHVDPSLGGRIELGFSGLEGDKFYLEVMASVDLFGFGRQVNGYAMGIGLGGNASAGGALLATDDIVLALVGGVEAVFRLHNLGRDGYVLSETTAITPRGGLVLLCGESRRFSTALLAGPSWAVVSWSDGTYVSDPRPNVAASVTAGIRF
ncbi:hypothetical protein COV06_03930 [Candidatus Uhrbacteria bacterium CG10_big_fil_rev_8_21_14_0_10_50_16]|uniref:Uncharacterized protein n=1 Tax=Candidatus Uhrbacteria bacterium CG10_big_fil_rev_8_21_14_0_10_50_16 TaxID=1975039 RepID=A0A2H0RMX6_9BACT|nr:MAG: hypothetical protein COV06_03930 [Candidatus Uhrbacteria bacterium CG10_big_fil_rev_8_21_14_0_10_50_16]